MPKRNLHTLLYPKQRRIMDSFGTNLLLALKRRKLTKKTVSERTGFDAKTIKKVFDGDPGVAIGVYLKVMSVLGMADNFEKISAHDELGLKLQEIELLKKRNAKEKTTNS